MNDDADINDDVNDFDDTDDIMNDLLGGKKDDKNKALGLQKPSPLTKTGGSTLPALDSKGKSEPLKKEEPKKSDYD